ncbi:hypothetical protein ABVF61_00605 [Roseibium sp. HPY-6]|uniref:hypothetical protein n=1 Tax=Roseibium sp. HPY-6 TaxID=3229852 RepID=UPI00338FD36F
MKKLVATGSIALMLGIVAFPLVGTAQEVTFTIAKPAGGANEYIQACTDVNLGGKTKRVCNPNLLGLEQIIEVANHQLFRSINSNQSQVLARTTNTDNNIGKLLLEITDLRKEIRETNNNQLLAIRDQLVTRIETLPLKMVGDPEVQRLIRQVVIEEVNKAIPSDQ